MRDVGCLILLEVNPVTPPGCPVNYPVNVASTSHTLHVLAVLSLPLLAIVPPGGNWQGKGTGMAWSMVAWVRPRRAASTRVWLWAHGAPRALCSLGSGHARDAARQPGIHAHWQLRPLGLCSNI